MIQYDLPVIPGTSGSAVFDEHMQVVAVNFFRIGQQGDFTFGVRSDELSDLIQWSRTGVVAPTTLSDLLPPVTTGCETSYYNTNWQFGFDLPPGFSGPIVEQDSSPFVARFEHDSSAQIRVTVFDGTSLTLEEAVAVSIAIRSASDSWEFLDVHEITTDDGDPAFLLEWQFFTEVGGLFDIFSFDLWTLGEFGYYEIEAQVAGLLWPEWEATFLNTVLSICTD